MNRQKQADLVLVIITFFWGIANPVSDYVMNFWQPMQLNALRFVVALAVSWASCIKICGRSPKRPFAAVSL